MALETSTRGEPQTDRNVPTKAQFQHPDWVWERVRSPRSTEMPFPMAGIAPARSRAFKNSMALMSIIVAFVSFRPACAALRRLAGSPKHLQQHCAGQSQLGRPSLFSY
jgi:hypothetical protein